MGITNEFDLYVIPHYNTFRMMNGESLQNLPARMRTQRNAFERLMECVPGYGGYQDRERRRDADRLLRQYVADQLEEARRNLVAGIGKRSATPGLSGLADLDRVARLVEETANRVKFADSGYAGLFSQIKMDGDWLDQLYARDLELIEMAVAIHSTAAQGDRPDSIPAIEKACRDLAARLADRWAMLEGAQP